MKQFVIQPTHLVAGKNVKFIAHSTGSNEAPASVSATRENNGKVQHYELHLYESECQYLFSKTPFAKNGVPYESFRLGVIIHEILHILNDTLNHTPSFKGAIIQYIWNVMVDSHDEYKGAYWFPSYSPFINLCLSCIKHVTPTHAEPESSLDIDLATWYHLVRFGVKHPHADPDFFTFAVQCALPGTRGTIQDALQASYAVYEYLRLKHEKSLLWKNEDQSSYESQDANTEEDMYALESMQQVFENDKAAIMKALASGEYTLLASVQEVAITYDMSDDSFYTSTVEQFADAIAEIAARFSKFIDAPESVQSYEGDMGMSIAEQMALFQSSYTGEDTRSYYRNVVHRPEIDVVVCHDISQSTEGFKERFAQACVLFFAAFEKVSGVRIAYVRFNACAKTVFAFDETPQRAAFSPEARGGTEMMPVLELTSAMDWRNENRLQFIFTDGEFFDIAEGEERIKTMQEGLNVHTYIIEVVKDYLQKTPLAGNIPNAYKSTLEDLSGKTMNRLILDILKSRNQLG